MKKRNIIRALLNYVQPRCENPNCNRPATTKWTIGLVIIGPKSKFYCDTCGPTKDDIKRLKLTSIDMHNAEIIREAIKTSKY